MPLSTPELQVLARLLDEALALPAEARARWLAALPDEHRALAGPLQQALAAADAAEAGAGGATALDALPALPSFVDPEAEADDPPREGDRIGGWRLVSELGQGGMGRVWCAERADGLYQRRVALKLPRLERSASLAARMALERQIGARLEHPHIARLYDAGLDEQGRPFLVMELVDGRPIDEHADAARLGLPARLRLLLQVCEAVAHAHRLLVVHRDIKPANVLVDAQGQVRLLDFGVARLQDGDAAGGAGSPTLSASPLGLAGHTPRFAAPEQRRGEPVGTATDVWALAMLGHLLLTGRLPADGADRRPSTADFGDAEARLRGLADARSLRRRLRGSLDAVFSLALADDPARRPAGADALAAEIRAVLARRVPASWAAPWPARLGLFVRRRAVPLAIATLALAGVATAAVLLLQEQARTRAEEARLDQARRFMLETLWQAEPQPGQSTAAVTTAQLLDTTLARARRDLAGEPLLQADVLHEVAVLARHLGRGAQAQALLREALALAGQGPGATRHIVGAQLALQRLDDGGADAQQEAEQLATEALAACRAGARTDGRRCAVARAYATAALSGVRAARGDEAGTLALMRDSVAAHGQAFGPDAPATGWQRLNLAARLRNAERWDEALAEVDRAAEAATRQPLGAAEQARLSTLQALLQADLGRHVEALRTLAGLRQALAASSPQRALAERLRAQSAFALGLLDETLAATDDAIAASRANGPAREATLALQTRLRALAALGRHDEAAAAWREAEAAVMATKPPPDGLLPQRQLRLAGERALRAGRPDDARALLERLLAAPRAASAMEQAQTLDLLGAVERAAGRPAAALALHERAAQALQGLPATHPLRRRNRLDQAWARSRLASPSPNDPALVAALGDYAGPLPAGSAWQSLAQRLQATEPAPLLVLP